MGHPESDNKTPFELAALPLLDEEGQPVLTVVVKGTFAIGADGRCTLADEQIPVNVSGEPWGDDPLTFSYRYEPEIAFTKPATDVVLIGHAVAPQAGTTEVIVGVKVGPVKKEAVVVGDRVWYKSLGQVSATKPRPFEKIPLRWERAFGGWDRSHPDPARHTCEARNPVGVGSRPSRNFQEGMLLPNIEDPQQPLRKLGEAPPPAGFGFISPHWQPRANLAGTFDERWQKERAPLLPKNFDRRHLNAAAPGLVTSGYLRGDETVLAAGVTAQGKFRFALPAVPPPTVRVALHDRSDQRPPMNLDTVIIEPDERRLLLLWRGMVVLPTGPLDVKAVEASRA